MRHCIAAGLISLLSTGAAFADTPGPTGLWLVRHGTAIIRIVNCGGSLWGVIAGGRGTGQSAGTDRNNPDPALRQRPVMGLPIVINMRPAQGRWSGQVYNAENGRTYEASISLRSSDVLHIEGCVLGFLCGGEDWTRQKAAKGTSSDAAVCSALR